MRYSLLLSLLALCGTFACGASSTVATDDDDDPAADASAPSSVVADAGAADVVAPVPVACVPDLVRAEVVDALVTTQPSTGARIWIVDAQDGDTFLTLTMRESAGAVAGAAAQGTFGEEQLQPGKTSLALSVQTECEAHGDHVHCGPTFVPTAGVWSVTRLDGEVGGSVAVTLSAELVEVTMRNGVARPVAGGSTMCMGELELRGLLEAN